MWPAAIYLNSFRGPVDANVTANYPLQSPKRLRVPPRPALQDWNGRQTWDSDRRVAVNNIQVMLVCGRPGDRGGGTETPAASVPRHKVQALHARYSEIRNPVWVIFAEGNRIVKYCVIIRLRGLVLNCCLVLA